MHGDSSVEQTRALKVTRRSARTPDRPPLVIYHNYSEQKLEPAPVQIFHHVCFPWTRAPQSSPNKSAVNHLKDRCPQSINPLRYVRENER